MYFSLTVAWLDCDIAVIANLQANNVPLLGVAFVLSPLPLFVATQHIAGEHA